MVKTRASGKRIRAPEVKPIVPLVVTAIYDLWGRKGSTPKKIIDYISCATNQPRSLLQKPVKVVLDRGLKYGFLGRFRGHYFLAFCKDARPKTEKKQTSVRFARLPTPVPSNWRSKGPITEPISEEDDSKNLAKSSLSTGSHSSEDSDSARRNGNC